MNAFTRKLARRLVACLYASLYGVALSLGAGPALALPTPTEFELEGNAVVDGSGDDWANTVPTRSASSEAFTSSFVVDGSGNKTIFTGGGSKDINDLSSWSWKDQQGGLPDKDNITNGYAAAYVNNGSLTIYFGADRFANDGDAQMGFWFFQSRVQAIGGKFVGSDGVTAAAHTVGDILILANLTNGGATVTIQVFKWVGGANPLQLLVSDLDAKCGSNTDPNVCAISNPGGDTAPWAYTAKDGTTGAFPQFSFIEGGINVAAFLGDQPECFSSFLVETRSSQSPTSTLKDFALGEFNTCKVEVNKTCTAGEVNATDTGFLWTYSGTISNDGFGNLYDARVIDAGPNQIIDTPTGGSISGDDILFPIGQLTPNQSVPFGGTFETIGSSPNPATNIARAEAAVTAGGALTVTATSDQTTCPQVSKSPELAVSKCCHPRLAVVDGTVRVKSEFSGQVCNKGNITLVNVSVVNDNGTPGDITDDTVILNGQTLGDTDNPATPADERCKTFSASYFPSSVNAGSSITDPDGAAFQDTVRANGSSVLFGAATEATGSATCKLCGQADCSVPPPLPEGFPPQ